MQEFGSLCIPEKITTKYALTKQDATNGRVLFLIQQGMFFHAYNHAAVFLRDVTHYQVRNVTFRGHDVEQLGVPHSTILATLDKLESLYNAEVHEHGAHYVILLDDDVAESIPYEHNINEDFSVRIKKPKPEHPLTHTPTRQNIAHPTPSGDPLRTRLQSVSLVDTTPMQALTILSELIALI